MPRESLKKLVGDGVEAWVFVTQEYQDLFMDIPPLSQGPKEVCFFLSFYSFLWLYLIPWRIEGIGGTYSTQKGCMYECAPGISG